MNHVLQRHRALRAAALLLLLLGACTSRPSPPPPADAANLVIDSPGIAIAAPGEALGAVLWLHPADPAGNLLVGAAGAGGLTLHSIDEGTRHPGNDEIEADHVALAYGFEGEALIVASDRGDARLWLFTVDVAQPALRVAHRRPLDIGTEILGLCTWRSRASGRHYVFVSGGDGLLQQWELAPAMQGAHARLVRRIALGAGIGACATDEADAAVYVADETVGIWRVAAEPESDAADRRLIDRTGPGGHARGEVKGLAAFNGVLLAMLDDGAALNAYALPEGRLLSTVLPTGDGLGELEAIWAGGMPAAGVLIMPDAQAAAGPRWRVLPWSQLAQAIGLATTPAGDPRRPAAAAAIFVEPAVETEPVDDHGDAADDLAIWLHPRDPAQSLLIGAQKKRGLEVYDLAGRRLQLLPDGRLNNVDLRQQVRLGASTRDVIAASNRTHGAISLYTIDAGTRRVRSVAAPIPTGMRDPYGLCMYVSGRDGSVYVFVNNSDRGEFGQWKLEPQGSGLGARLVREFVVGSQAEGCVADDDTGALYIAEEDVGLWRYGAEPDAGDTRRLVDATGAGGNLTADAEGVAIFRRPDGTGYLVLSNQGADNYAVYRRDGDNAFLGLFSIGANDELGIDGASETDGLEVTSQPLGPQFPHGLLVVQDGRNLTPEQRQNFKLVPWERVATAMGLE